MIKEKTGDVFTKELPDRIPKYSLIIKELQREKYM